MGEPRIRLATDDDVRVVEQIVDDAYRSYIPRIGKPPGPMLDDYSARVAARSVSLVEDSEGIVAAIIVLIPHNDHLLLDNIAIAPERGPGGLRCGRRYARSAIRTSGGSHCPVNRR